MNDNEQITFSYFLAKRYRPIAFHLIENNGCCDKPFFILTANPSDSWPGGINYSCQCACGGWCTNGHDNEADAVEEYKQMCNRYEEERRKTS